VHYQRSSALNPLKCPPIDKAGVESRDIITAVNGEAVENANQLDLQAGFSDVILGDVGLEPTASCL
jgi:S1-C subfamily serine protease